MTDYSELKRLAEAATPGKWTARTDDLGYAITTVGRFRIIVGSAPADDPEPDAQFIAAANPATVLALIAENERLIRDAECAVAKQAHAEMIGDGFYHASEKLKAEVEALRQAAGLAVLLPQLDEALEDLELYGRHADQGYRKLKDWYRKVKLACAAIDAAMGKEAAHD
jgi:hypothetical protein